MPRSFLPLRLDLALLLLVHSFLDFCEQIEWVVAEKEKLHGRSSFVLDNRVAYSLEGHRPLLLLNLVLEFRHGVFHNRKVVEIFLGAWLGIFVVLPLLIQVLRDVLVTCLLLLAIEVGLELCGHLLLEGHLGDAIHLDVVELFRPPVVSLYPCPLCHPALNVIWPHFLGQRAGSRTDRLIAVLVTFERPVAFRDGFVFVFHVADSDLVCLALVVAQVTYRLFRRLHERAH